jgi:hypothetical protein
MNLKVGGLYECMIDRDLFVVTYTSPKKTKWVKHGILKANSLFVILEAEENQLLNSIAPLSETSKYVDLKILTPTGEICYIFCYSDEFEEDETKS